MTPPADLRAQPSHSGAVASKQAAVSSSLAPPVQSQIEIKFATATGADYQQSSVQSSTAGAAAVTQLGPEGAQAPRSGQQGNCALGAEETAAVQDPGWPAARVEGSVSDRAAQAESSSKQPAPEHQCQRQLALARLLFKRGKHKDATVVIETYSSWPKDADLCCLKGRCLACMGDHAGAFASYMGALAIEDGHVDTLMACAELQKKCGMLADAVTSLQRAHAGAPNDTGVCQALAIVLTDIGTSLQASHDAQGAQDRYDEAIRSWASHAPAHYNLGVLQTSQGQVDQALQSYATALELQPHYAEAHCNIGVIHKQAGRLGEALAAYERALELAPCYETIRVNLAIALTEQGLQRKAAGQASAAMQLYERALALRPQHAEALYSMGVACFDAGHPERASFFYESATTHAPRCAEAWNNLGVVQRQLRNLERAAQCYVAALQLRPSFPEALNNMAVIYASQGRAHDAMQLLQAALACSPQYAEACNTLGVLQQDVGCVRDAIASYERCMIVAPNSRNAFQNRLLALNSIVPGDDPQVCSAHAEWGRSYQAQVQQSLPDTSQPAFSGLDRDPDRPLVVGYVSADLFTHSVSYFAEAPLTHHALDRVRPIVYCCAPRPDAKTQRLKQVVAAAGGAWHDVEKLDEAALAEQVQGDSVDILVELAGQTANNRLGLMAMKPAPIQVTWIGYPNSTGLPAVDYRLTDSMCDPEGTLQTFTEQLVRLPGCFLAYTPSPDLPDVGPLPALANGFITFGSFNGLAKITAEVMRLWAQILRRVPGSRLLLKNKPFACETTCRMYLQRLAAEGVDTACVDLLPLTPGTPQHLATYNDMDISLDPFPYTGTTTTAESLLMGVPVVTRTGQCHAHNVSASLMQTVGMPASGWIACNSQEYADAAVRASQNIQQLARIRAELRPCMLGSTLCDGAGFVGRLEHTYRSMWHAWLHGCKLGDELDRND